MASQLNFTKISPGVTSTNSSQINGQSFGPALPKFNSKWKGAIDQQSQLT